MILIEHQVLGALGVAVVPAEEQLGIDPAVVGIAVLQLYHPHEGVIEDPDKLAPDPVLDTLDTQLLYGADALCLDQDLVGHR